MKSAIDGILYGNGDQLWESFNQELNKRLEEAKRINARLRQDKYSSAEPSKVQNNANANSDNILLKQKQQEFYNLSMNYESMKNSFSVQIQQESQEIDKYKNDIEIISMQINSILNQIMAKNRPFNIPKNEVDNIQKLNSHRPNVIRNDSFLPQLNPSKQPIILSSRVAFSALPHSNNIENNEIRYPVSEPQINGNARPFYRSNQNFVSVNNSNNDTITNIDDSSGNMSDYNHISTSNSYDTSSSIKLDRKSNIDSIKHSYSSSTGGEISSNACSSIGHNFDNSFCYDNNCQYNTKKSSTNSDNSFNCSENNSNDIHYFSSLNPHNIANVRSDSLSNDNPKPTTCTIYINHNQEKKKADQMQTEFKPSINDDDDYLNEIDEIISDSFEEQNNSDDENQ